MTEGGSGGEEVVVVMRVEATVDVGEEVFGVEDGGVVDVGFALDGDGVKVEEQCLVGEGEGVALTVKFFGLNGISCINDNVICHRIGHDTIEVCKAEEILLVGGVVHTVHCRGCVLDATIEGGVHLVGAAIDGLAGTVALGVNEAQFLQGGGVGNKTGIKATTPLRLREKSANYTDIPLRKTADPELAIVTDVVRHLGGHIGLVEIGLYVSLQQLAQAVDFGRGAGKEVVENGFGGVKGHRSRVRSWGHFRRFWDAESSSA